RCGRWRALDRGRPLGQRRYQRLAAGPLPPQPLPQPRGGHERYHAAGRARAALWLQL
nr:hypothetical protein [Tanacetum cinerariifolium]